MPAAESRQFAAALRNRFDQKQRRRIRRAAEHAAELHQAQLRANGAPYIVHPLAVAGIVAAWLQDEEAVISALLHDAIEDTPLTLEQLEGGYGETVTRIVDGVTNIEKIEHVGRQERRADTFRKLLLAVARDWRVLLIKLADRIHNMRTLIHLPAGKRRRIAAETLEIYAPLAERLGFRAARDELQVLAFEHLHPLRYATLTQALQRSGRARRLALPAIESKLKNILAEDGIAATVHGRAKNLYSIYRKMIEKRLRFAEVDDIIGFRIVVGSRAQCYQVLGIIHEHFRPIPFKVKDYIGMPKNNGYQSLHTAVLDKSGVLIELQIRTVRMHEFAERGLAAHWHYKQSNAPNAESDEQMQSQATRMLAGLLDLPAKPDGAREFLHDLRIDLFPNDIYVMSPKGRVVHLPKGASALDFAYEIHTGLGDRAEAAEINGKTLPVSAKLASGDIINIVISKVAAPHPQWLNFVVTSRARSHIRSVLRNSWALEMEAFGANLLEQALARTGNALADVSDVRWQNFFRMHIAHGTRQALLIEIALGKMDALIVAKELLGPDRARGEGRSEVPIEIAGDSRAGISIAPCCSPLPPEPICGTMLKGKGMVVHRKDCETFRKSGGYSSRISLSWAAGGDSIFYRTRITLECTNRRKLFTDVIQHVRSSDINIADVRLTGGQAGNPVVTIELEVEVEDARQAEKLLRKLGDIPGVLTAQRAGAVSFG